MPGVLLASSALAACTSSGDGGAPSDGASTTAADPTADAADLRSHLPDGTRGPTFFGDQVFAVPQDVGQMMLHHREDLFNQLGPKVPTTWAGFGALAAEVGQTAPTRYLARFSATAPLELPDGFVWGAATAAFQVEGAVDEDEKGVSVWDTFTSVPGAIAGGDTATVACDHDHRYPEDIGLLADLGFGAYRFSVSWPRIQPEGVGPANAKGIDHYRRVVETCLERGVTPYVTLYHWDLPQAPEVSPTTLGFRGIGLAGEVAGGGAPVDPDGVRISVVDIRA